MPLAFEDWASPAPGPKSPLQTWLEGLFAGGPAPMQPDLVSQQLGAPLEPGQTRRPNVLPFTTDAQTGQLQLAMPRFLDILGNALPGAVPAALAPVKALPGEKVLGAGPLGFPGTQTTFEEIVAGLKNAQETQLKAWGEPKTPPAAPTIEELQAQLADVMTKMPPAPKKDPFEQIPFTEQDYLKQYPTAKADPTDAYYAALKAQGAEITGGEKLPSAFPADLATAPIKLYEDFLANGFTLLPSEAALLNKTPEGQALVQKFANKGLWHEPGTGPIGPTEPLTAEPFLDEGKRAQRLSYADEFIGPPLPQRELPLDEATRLARAAELGFKTDLPLYTGVPAWGPEILGFKDPRKGKWMENAIFLTDEPKITNYYTGTDTHGNRIGQVVPAFVNPKNPKTVDWLKETGAEDYQGTVMNKLIVDALAKGHDFMEIKNIGDVGGLQNQYLVFDPNILRSKFAKFDPKNIDANDLSAAIAAAFGVGGAAAAVAPREKANF